MPGAPTSLRYSTATAAAFLIAPTVDSQTGTRRYSLSVQNFSTTGGVWLGAADVAVNKGFYLAPRAIGGQPNNFFDAISGGAWYALADDGAPNLIVTILS